MVSVEIDRGGRGIVRELIRASPSLRIMDNLQRFCMCLVLFISSIVTK